MEYHSRSDHLAKPPQRTANYAERFALQIEAEDYGSGSLAKYSPTAKALWSAMEAAKLSPANLTDDCMEQFPTPIINAVSEKDRKHCRHRLNRFRDYLIENANAAPRLPPQLDMLPRACLKREYETYLRVQR